MNLSDVTEAMNPGAKLVIDKRLGYHEATRIFQHALVQEAMNQSDGVERRAAMILGVSNSWLNRMRSGKAEKRVSKRRGSEPAGEKNP